MTIDVWQQNIDANYRVLGVPAVFQFPGVTDGVAAKVIDHTSQIDGHAGSATFADIEPVCRVRCSELKKSGVTDWDDVLEATVTFNGSTWTITKYFQVSTPTGPGELELILRQDS